MIEISQIRHFVAVAQARNFTRASEQLHASQSVISRSIQAMEDRMGVRLLERSTRNVSLTAAGTAFLDDALMILSRLAIGCDNARRIEQGPFARLRVGICETTESRTIVNAISAFREEFPDVDFRLQAMMSNQQPDALRSSALDIGIMQSPGNLIAGLQWRVIAQYRLVLAVPAAWGYPVGKPARLIDLKDRPWLMPSEELAADWRNALIGLCGRAGFAPRIVGIIDDPVTARIMIASGIGATFVHDKGTANMAEGIQLVQFTDPQNLPPSETMVVWPTSSTGPQLEGFIRNLTVTFSPSAPKLPRRTA